MIDLLSPRTQYLLNLIHSLLVSEQRVRLTYSKTIDYDAQRAQDLGEAISLIDELMVSTNEDHIDTNENKE